MPAKYRDAFRGHEDLLGCHRGWDGGALETARIVAAEFEAPLHTNTVTRLLIDFNRSLGNPEMFSEVSAGFHADEKRKLIEEYYLPYRRAAEERMADWIGSGLTVLHLSMHTFGSVVNGVRRNADVGLLYDPACPDEVTFCKEWKAALLETAPDVPVRRNYPYSGTDDGFTRQLRALFPPDQYAGIELELNSRDFYEDEKAWKRLRDRTVAALKRCLRIPRNAAR